MTALSHVLPSEYTPRSMMTVPFHSEKLVEPAEEYELFKEGCRKFVNQHKTEVTHNKFCEQIINAF